jgi:potassium efflux system protein
MENVLNRRPDGYRGPLSIVRLMHYALVLVGFLIALSALGFELKNVTIIGGALGVGIGFGMQAIVNNFVSGLILLFERPIKVGDVIQLSDGQQGRVLNLGLRATTVQTFDRAEIVVPNADLIANQVTNWTLGDRSMRLTIPVGVAYGSDVETVMRELHGRGHGKRPGTEGSPDPWCSVPEFRGQFAGFSAAGVDCRFQ